MEALTLFHKMSTRWQQVNSGHLKLHLPKNDCHRNCLNRVAGQTPLHRAHRVFQQGYGTIEDWLAIKSFYGLERIKNEMLQERHLDKKTLSFLSCIFDIPKEKFRCYTEHLSSPPHWNF